jgi:hypothetical protein
MWTIKQGFLYISLLIHYSQHTKAKGSVQLESVIVQVFQERQYAFTVTVDDTIWKLAAKSASGK